MKVSSLSLNKGRDAAGHNVSSWARFRNYALLQHSLNARSASTQTKAVSETKISSDSRRTALNGRTKDPNADKFANRDFFLSVLDSSATKRDAKAYLQRFTPIQSPTTSRSNAVKSSSTSPRKGCGVNLGSFYGPTRAVEDTPRFIQYPDLGSTASAMVAPLHVALVKIRAPQTMTDEVLDGIGRTLSQLAKLGLTSIVVVDCEDADNRNQTEASKWRSTVIEQADRVCAAIDSHGQPGARKVDSAIGVLEDTTQPVKPVAAMGGRTHVTHRKLLMTPLRRGVIPVIPTMGYTDTSHEAIPLDANDIVLALTRELAGFKVPAPPDEDPTVVAENFAALRSEVSMDRLIILDPVGGIPSKETPGRVHVFLNMEQEFEGVKQDLLSTTNKHDVSQTVTTPSASDIARGNPFISFAEAEFGGSLPGSNGTVESSQASKSSANRHHLNNLQLIRQVLSILPPNSSALLTSPEEAANSGKQSQVPFQAIGVGTRRKRNPLIYNLLTDKPVFSSSLPASRVSSTPIPGIPSSQPSSRKTPTTFAKKGMSVTIFPDPKISPWQPPAPGGENLALTDPRIDLPRLVHLIDDSFSRTLDVEAYLGRIKDRVAGVIIAGEYEGGALLTWELPPGVPDDGSEASRSRMVPYLDKFAVLKRSQGAGGVADILFKSMVRDCFPGGVCWRSRRNNPVNKWYFERSRGTWKMPGTNWTMFWTTPGMNLESNRQVFSDYEGVCRSIQPTWADGKKVID